MSKWQIKDEGEFVSIISPEGVERFRGKKDINLILTHFALVLEQEESFKARLAETEALISQVSDHVGNAMVDIGEDARECPDDKFVAGELHFAQDIDQILHDESCRQINIFEQAAEDSWKSIAIEWKRRAEEAEASLDRLKGNK